MKYEKPEANEWVQPVKRGYKFRCCDCGLVHKMNFRMVSPDGRKLLRGKVQFQADRDERATAAVRRERRKKADKP